MRLLLSHPESIDQVEGEGLRDRLVLAALVLGGFLLLGARVAVLIAIIVDAFELIEPHMLFD